MLQLGWKAGPEQFAPDKLLDFAVAAEESGFDLLEVSDHFHPWSDDGQACFTWTWLGAAAVRTSRIGLGTGVTCPIFRYHPAVVAQMAATLGVMAPGRAFLCVGTGEALNEYAATGHWPDYGERQARMEEAIELIRDLWRGEQVSFEGTYYETRQAKLYTRPDKPVPLYISGLVPDSAAFAGRQGDGLITTGGKQPGLYRQMIQSFEEGARQAGKDPASMPRIVEINVAFTDDVDTAVAEMKTYWAGSFLPALFNQKIYTPAMSAENGQAVGADTIKQQMPITTNPDAHVRLAQQYIDLGFNVLIFHSAQVDQRSFLEGYGREVLPRLRQNQASSGKQLAGAAV
jgi:coenzyme F420-dependent glucose-6-phosphate dehydrogenase